MLKETSSLILGLFRLAWSCLRLLVIVRFNVITILFESVNAHGYEKIRAELEKSCKAVRVASDVEPSSSLSEPVFVSERLPEQSRRPAQRPRIDISETHHSGVAELLAGKLRSKRKTSNPESSSVLMKFVVPCFVE